MSIKAQPPGILRDTVNTCRIYKTAEEHKVRADAATRIMAFSQGLPEIAKIDKDIEYCLGLTPLNYRLSTRQNNSKGGRVQL